MGEKDHEPFQFTFNGFLKVDFQGSRVTADAGLLLVRELDERLGLAPFIAEHLSDSRHGLNTRFGPADLLRQSVYSRLAGYEDLNDVVRLAADPAFRLIGSPSFQYQAGSWTTPRRVVAKVEHHVGELFPQVGFMVTNLRLPNRADAW